ncbi:hypothetical protein ES703_60202 [subsurface metagenome]
MALEFINDAISLSGLTGSKLKSEIISEYYPFWWNITSGGEGANHEWATAIIELDAATGEMYIKDTKETILGSSGHALALKCNNSNTKKLKIVLVEKDINCYSHLKKVINRRWPNVNIFEAEGPLRSNKSNIYLMNVELDETLRAISQLDLGNSLFFFDPLRSVAYETIEEVAKARIKSYYQTGTEFIIFVFTSDWFLGRDDFAGLPTTFDETSWSQYEKKAVVEADGLFGNTNWRAQILNNKPIYEREYNFIELYKKNLHKWFRYVFPMPFNPKAKQIFHLILCSNYEVGVRATRGFFCERTNNPDYKPDNKQAFVEFRNKHKEIFEGLKGNQRPKQWRILWKTITGHEEGCCDYMCRDFEDIEQVEKERIKLLEWLANNGYMTRCDTSNSWKLQITQYRVNWQSVKDILAIEPPLPLEPLSLKPLSLKEISK